MDILHRSKMEIYVELFLLQLVKEVVQQKKLTGLNRYEDARIR